MILISGHRGFVGTLLSQKLGDFGVDIKDGLNLLTCDLPTDIDTIYHLAAQTSVEASWHDPMHDADNLKMTIRLAKAYPKAKIIYANSAAAIEPISSPYGFSKWVCAEYLKRFHPNYVICTFPNVYGPGSKSVVDIFKDQKKVTVFGDGKQIRDYVHVDDIVDALVKAKDWPTGEYQLGSEIPTTVLELAKGKEITFAPARKEARESVLKNTTKGWKPKVQVLKYIK